MTNPANGIGTILHESYYPAVMSGTAAVAATVAVMKATSFSQAHTVTVTLDNPKDAARIALLLGTGVFVFFFSGSAIKKLIERPQFVATSIARKDKVIPAVASWISRFAASAAGLGVPVAIAHLKSRDQLIACTLVGATGTALWFITPAPAPAAQRRIPNN